MKIEGVVVTGVGGGVGQSILKALLGSDYRVIGVDSLVDAAGLYAVPKAYLGKFAKDGEFIDRLLEICKREKANVIFPGLDVELLYLSKNRKLFEENGVNVIVSSEKIVKIADDKFETAAFLSTNGFCVPRTELKPWEDMKYPVVVKPRFGGVRSMGYKLCRNEAELREAIVNNGNFIVQEYIEGDEYTCGTLSWEGKCYGCIPIRRELRAGDTYKAYVADRPDINSYVSKVIETLKPYGPCNVQLREKDGQFYIFEFNARCSGTTAIRAMAGFNEPKWVCAMLENKTPDKLNYRTIAVLRYWNEIEVDLGDMQILEQTGTLSGRRTRFMVMSSGVREPRKVFVTGASGFIGRNIVLHLLREGFHVKALIRKPGINLFNKHKNLEVITADLNELDKIKEEFTDINVFCHCAAYIPADYKNAGYAQKCLNENAILVLRLGEILSQIGRCHFIYLSTGSVYRHSQKPVDESSELYPVDNALFYSASKLLGEMYLKHLSDQNRLSLTILRLGSCYGPYMQEKCVVKQFINSALSGDQIRLFNGGRAIYNFVYVEDVARTVVEVITNSKHGVFNVASEESCSIKDLADIVIKIFSSGDCRVLEQTQPHEARGLPPLNVSKLVKELNITPLSLYEGLMRYKETVNVKEKYIV